MSTRVAVVTGSNKGIGLAIVRNLCEKFDGDVFLTARNPTLGQEAVESLKKEGLNPKFHTLDIDNMDSILQFREFLQKTYGGLDCLVNNAGFAYKVDAKEPFYEQAEVTNRINFTATMNLCNELFPLLRKHARVSNVSSVCGMLKQIKGKEPQASELRKKFADPNLTKEQLIAMVNNFVELTKSNTHEEHGWPNSAYNVSKVALTALTRIQQREFDEQRPNDDIVVNSCHPGYVDTDMTSHKGQLTPAQGAVAPTWLALLPPNVETPRGGYVWYEKTIIDWVNDGPTPTPY